jgi:hypothetical protein
MRGQEEEAVKPIRWEDITTTTGEVLHVNHRRCMAGSRWQRYWMGTVLYYLMAARRWMRRAREAEAVLRQIDKGFYCHDMTIREVQRSIRSLFRAEYSWNEVSSGSAPDDKADYG